MQKILSKREKLILIVTGSVIFVSIGFNLVVEPLLARNSVLNKEINVSRAKLKKYLRLLGQGEYLKEQYDKFTQPFEPDDIIKGASLDALSEIERLAKESGVKISDIRPESARISDDYKESVIEIRAEADMANYLKFIYNIEKSPSLLAIKSFQLNAKPNSKLLEGDFFISQIALD